MVGKYVIVIFICTCVSSEVLSSHAHYPRPIADRRGHPINKAKPNKPEIDNETSIMFDDESKRDEDSVVSAPKTILSVQYDRGYIKKLFLSQNAEGKKEDSEEIPSVSEKTQICEDLCQSGLGGDPCGSSCLDSTPIFIRNGIASPLEDKRPSNSSGVSGTKENDPKIGNPRVDVCPTLCKYGLGSPLCVCSLKLPVKLVSWQPVCDAFCTSSAGSYRVDGCPECEATRHVGMVDSKNSMSSELWEQYCREKCRTGDGGAACNCDKIPFALKA